MFTPPDIQVLPRWQQAGFTLIELMVIVTVLSVLALLATPNYLKYRAKSYSAEVKTNLGGIFIAEWTYFGETSRFSGFNDIGFALAGTSNRYTYRTRATAVSGGVVNPGAVEIFAPGIGSLTPEHTLYAAASSTTGFTATATSDLDADPTIDQWHVNDLQVGINQADVDDIML